MSDDATEQDVAASTEKLTKREGHASERKHSGESSTYLERGAPIGRYVVIDRLGEGGMGVVYSAFDPELDRKVAIKLLQAKPDGSQSKSSGEQTWLLREAQALARLAHPNVVSVHDVGTLPGDRVFVAMELVDGLTLRKWLREQERSWREVLPVLVAAGQGLAAAHAAGLVHRDFKPDNVLVGNDGRVRVMDFGLAKARPGLESGPVERVSASDLLIETKSPLSDSLTEAGTVLGTPAYLAPELYDGEAADAASDQFSYGVTLCEALFGKRPFAKEQLMPPRKAPPKPAVPEAPNVPVRIQRAALRAIAIDPAQRFPSMAALLAELGVDPNAGRRRALIVGGVLAVAVAGVAGVLVVGSGNPEPCQGIEQRLGGVWDAGVKKKIKDAFAATKKGYAAQAFTLLERSLDGYAKDWTATSVESCRATRVRRDQTEEVLSLRQGCLDQRLEELRAVTQLLGEPDASVVDKAEKIGGQLEPLVQCSNVAMLRAPGQPAPEQRAKVAATHKQLAEARANMLMGRYLPALVLAQKALDGAREISYEPRQAEALLVRGAALMATGNPTDAVEAYSGATWMALRSKRDDVAAAAALLNAMVSAEILGKPNEGKIYLQLADAAAARAGMVNTLSLKRDMVAGIVLAQSGDNEGAVAAHEAALAAVQRAVGPDDPSVWGDEVMLATTLTKSHIYGKAVKHFEHAMALREKTVGRDHADIAAILTNLGVAYGHLGDGPKGREAFERALAIREKIYGPKNPLMIVTLNNFADHLRLQKDYAAALVLADRALAIAEKAPGKDHPVYHSIATTKAEILTGAGRIAEARKLFDEIMIAEQAVKSETMALTLASRADLELADHHPAEAVSFAQRSVAEFERLGGPDNAEMVSALITLAKAHIARKDNAAAKALLERAIAIGKKAGVDAVEIEPAQDVLATLHH